MKTCAICEMPIEESRSVYEEVRGFVRVRKAGGANQIRRRESTGRIAHVACVERTEVAQIPGQLSFT